MRIIEEEQQFSASGFYSDYLKIMIPPMVELFDHKLKLLDLEFENSTVYELQLASISLSITEESGLLYNFVKLWMSYCEFKIKALATAEDTTLEEKSIGIRKYFHQ